MKTRLASHHWRLALAAMLLVSAVLLAGSSPALAQASTQQTDQYHFLPLDVPTELGTLTTAFGINNQGVIVGNYFSVDETIDGFVFERGEFTQVAVPGRL